MDSNEVEFGHFCPTLPRVTFLAFLCVFFFCSFASGSEKCGSLDRVVSALRVVKAVYPEFKQQELDVALGNGNSGPISYPTDGRDVLITVAADSWHPPEWWKAHPEGPPSASTSVIWGDIELPVYLRFDYTTGKSEPGCRPIFGHDFSAAHKAVVELVDAHPEWTNKETLAAAKRAGLRFGPDEKAKLLGSLPLRELSVVYGPLRVKRAKLLLTQEHEKDAKFDFGLFWWDITANEIGTKRILLIRVDPFDGRIFGCMSCKRT